MNPNKPFVIDVDNPKDPDVLFDAKFRRGTVPRDYDVQPLQMHAVQMPTIPRPEWSDRLKEQIATKSRLTDLWHVGNAGQKIPHLDQGRFGYCWAHSTTHAEITLRAKQNLPYVPLSAFAVAATIKNGRDEGGWGALSLQFATERGIPDQKFWPQGSASLKYGTAECWADAANHKVVEQWTDVAAQVWDRELSFEQVATCLLTGIPVVSDFNWWSHSVCALDLVEVEPGSFGIYILNSWAGWGDDLGGAVLRGTQAVPDGAVAPATTLGN